MTPLTQNEHLELFEAHGALLGLTRGKWGGQQPEVALAAPRAAGRWGKDTRHPSCHSRGGRELRGLLARDMEGTWRSPGSS